MDDRIENTELDNDCMYAKLGLPLDKETSDQTLDLIYQILKFKNQRELSQYIQTFYSLIPKLKYTDIDEFIFSSSKQCGIIQIGNNTVEIGKKLSAGSYGTVYKAELNDNDIAMKKPKRNIEEFVFENIIHMLLTCSKTKILNLTGLPYFPIPDFYFLTTIDGFDNNDEDDDDNNFNHKSRSSDNEYYDGSYDPEPSGKYVTFDDQFEEPSGVYITPVEHDNSGDSVTNSKNFTRPKGIDFYTADIYAGFQKLDMDVYSFLQKKKCTPLKVFSIILQVAYLSNAMYDAVSFVQRDLHKGNVMLKKVKKFYIQYNNFLIPCRYKVYFIDFGEVCVNFGKCCGVQDNVLRVRAPTFNYKDGLFCENPCFDLKMFIASIYFSSPESLPTQLLPILDKFFEPINSSFQYPTWHDVYDTIITKDDNFCPLSFLNSLYNPLVEFLRQGKNVKILKNFVPENTAVINYIFD